MSRRHWTFRIVKTCPSPSYPHPRHWNPFWISSAHRNVRIGAGCFFQNVRSRMSALWRRSNRSVDGDVNGYDDYDDDDDYDEEDRYDRQPDVSDPDGFRRRPECVFIVRLSCTEIQPKTTDQTEPRNKMPILVYTLKLSNLQSWICFYQRQCKKLQNNCLGQQFRYWNSEMLGPTWSGGVRSYNAWHVGLQWRQ